MAENHSSSHPISKRLEKASPNLDQEQGAVDEAQPESILSLQRVIGNQATLRLLRNGELASIGLQRGMPVIQRGNSGNEGMTKPKKANKKKPMKSGAQESTGDKLILQLPEGTTFQSAISNERDAALNEFMQTLPPPFNHNENRKKVREIVRYVKQNEFREGVYRQLHVNAWKVMRRLQGDAELLKERFGIDFNTMTVTFTGSDFHNDGQQVVIIESGTGKVVYKPRTTSPDKNLTGDKNSVLSELNKMNPQGTQLPTMKFVEMGGGSSKSEAKDVDQIYSYVEHQEHSETKTHEQTETYYRQMGALAVISKLTGTTDLHDDNIMSTAKGPSVIDGETSFLPHTMFGPGFKDTALVATVVGGSVSAISYFKTEGLGSQDKKRMQNPQYQAAFVAGAREMLSLIKAKKDKVIQLMVGKMKATKHVRLVPLKTSSLAGAILCYRRKDYSSVINIFDNELFASAAQFDADGNGFASKGYKIDPSCMGFIWEKFRQDIANGDVPIFYYEPAINKVLYHGMPIGEFDFDGFGSLEAFMRFHIDQMLKSGEEGLTEDFELKKF